MSDAATAHKPMPMLPQSAPGDEPMELDERTGSSANSAMRRGRAHAPRVASTSLVEGRSRARVQVEEVVPLITKATVSHAAPCREREHMIVEAR